MRKLTTLALILSALSLSAQVPDAFNYQAVARNAAGAIMANQTISVTFRIFPAFSGGIAQFEEDHSVTTNQFGLFTAKIGLGTPVTGTLAGVNWAGNENWLEVEVNGTIIGSRSQFVSVPYALLARDVENDAVDDADADPTNELQTLSKAGNVITLSNGGGSVTDDNTSYTAGSGISISGSNVISNTAPDQTVMMGSGTGISVTGTYPNFTITNTGDTDPSNDITNTTTAGGDLNGTYPNPTVDGLQGRTVAATAPANGEVLKWNTGNNRWEPATDNTVGGGAVTGSGTTNYLSKWTGSTALGNSVIYETGGLVGIGTTTPTYAHEVVSAVAGSSFLVQRLSTLNPNSFVDLEGSATGGGAFRIRSSGGTGQLRFQTNGLNDRMVIDNIGNVGIGDMTPAALFTVGNGDKFQVAGAEGDVTFSDPLGSITFPPTAGANSGMINMFASGTGNADRMVIQHSPPFPNYGLQYQDAADKFVFIGANSPVLTADLGNLRVGVGTTTPNSKLHIHGSGVVNYIVLTHPASGTTSTDGLYIGHDAGEATTYFWNYENSDIHMGTGGTGDIVFYTTGGSLEAARIDGASGFVGVGTGLPVYPLHVSSASGTGTVGYFHSSNGFASVDIDADNGDAALRFVNNGSIVNGINLGNGFDMNFFEYGQGSRIWIEGGTGNVGVGTASPAYKVDALGIIQAQADGGGTNENIRAFSTSTASGGYGAIELSDGSTGVSLYGVELASDLNVGDIAGVFYQDVNAASFNVLSDRNMKRDIRTIAAEDAAAYMSMIRSIETARFKYVSETDVNRPVDHIGVIAQTLPAEVQVSLSKSPGSASQGQVLGVALADLAGLTLVGVKAIDARQSEMELTIQQLLLEIDLLKARIEELENQ